MWFPLGTIAKISINLYLPFIFITDLLPQLVPPRPHPHLSLRILRQLLLRSLRLLARTLESTAPQLQAHGLSTPLLLLLLLSHGVIFPSHLDLLFRYINFLFPSLAAPVHTPATSAPPPVRIPSNTQVAEEHVVSPHAAFSGGGGGGGGGGNTEKVNITLKKNLLLSFYTFFCDSRFIS
jgi:hypothetical protein